MYIGLSEAIGLRRTSRFPLETQSYLMQGLFWGWEWVIVRRDLISIHRIFSNRRAARMVESARETVRARVAITRLLLLLCC